jgi:PIN domain nuclease of toxin-antitoxin system
VTEQAPRRDSDDGEEIDILVVGYGAAALAMGLTVETFTASDVARAAELIAYSRVSHRDAQGDCLSLGDGLGLAVAERLELPITGGDQLWAALPLTVQFMPFCR